MCLSTGGTKKNPTYHSLGNHTETTEIDFDPAVISYAQLLDIFWSSHNPTTRKSAQYKSGIWYHSPEQEKAARASSEAYASRTGSKVYTTIEQADTFYMAEDYHQKFYLQNEHRLKKAVYTGSFKAFVDSFVAARVNGFVGGYGSIEQLMAEIDGYGLENEARELLIKRVKRSGGWF